MNKERRDAEEIIQRASREETNRHGLMLLFKDHLGHIRWKRYLEMRCKPPQDPEVVEGTILDNAGIKKQQVDQ